MSDIAALAVILFFVLGWGFDLIHTPGPSGLTSLLVALWALPGAILVETIKATVGEISWGDWWDAMSCIPAIIKEAWNG